MTEPLAYQTPAAGPMRGALTQTAALFLDAYRELNARRLFWIVLVVSVVVVVAFALPGINARGITLFRFEFAGVWNTHVMSAGQFYKTIYTLVAIPLWLAWAAIILALLSTASIFPDFLAGGSIDLYLSKPIGRLRLFLTKYLTGLMFVALQVTVFSLGSFLAIGIRGHSWEPGLFLAIPIVVALFSYLYSVCVLAGVLTRSTLTAILLTLIAWLTFWAVDLAEQTVFQFEISQERAIADSNRVLANDDQILAGLRAQPTSQMANQPLTSSAAAGIQNWEFQRAQTMKSRDERRPVLDRLTFAHHIIFDVKTVLPKTGETTKLLARWLTRMSDLPGMAEDPDDATPQHRHRGPFDRGTKTDFERDLRNRPVAWVLGTSLGFEAVMVALSAWIFCRRDY